MLRKVNVTNEIRKLRFFANEMTQLEIAKRKLKSKE